MGEDQNICFEFGEFHLDPHERRLLRNGDVVALTPKAFDTLCLFVEHAGHLLDKDRLMRSLWAESFVEEGNLADNISKIRQVLGDSRKDPKFIETVSGRGYRFIADVVKIEAENAREPIDSGDIESHLPVANELPDVEAASDADEEVHPSKVDSNAPIPFTESSTSRWRQILKPASAVLIIALVAGLLYYSWNFKAARSSPPPLKTTSIAVLPFKPLVASHRDESLELGISDTLISGLSRLRTLSVHPISAVRRYAGLEQDAVTAGRELRVQNVLDGNIQRSGDGIRISARLVRVEDGVTLWSETYDEKFTNIFAVQDSISSKIVSSLALQLSGEELKRLTKRYTANTEAYNLYLKGRFFWRQLTPDGLQKSIEFYSQAIEIDPSYALGYAGLADSYNLLGSYSFWPLRDSHPKARTAAEKALELDPDLAEAHTSLAAVLDDYYWEWESAENHFKIAIALDPNYSLVHSWYSQHLARMGKLDEGVEEALIAQRLDPLSSSAAAQVGLALFRARRFDEAAAALEKTLEFNPNALDAHIFLGFVYTQQKKYDEAIGEFQSAVTLSERKPGMLALLGYAYGAAGKREKAAEILTTLSSGTEDRPILPVEKAMIHIALGENESAFEWLEKAYNERAWQLGFLKVEPIFDPLRDDPRFYDLMSRVNLKP